MIQWWLLAWVKLQRGRSGVVHHSQAGQSLAIHISGDDVRLAIQRRRERPGESHVMPINVVRQLYALARKYVTASYIHST